MDAHEAIVTKRDTRSYSTQAVDDETLRRVLQAGRMAGSAKNRQTARIVVVTEAETKAAIKECGDYAAWTDQAPYVLAIAVSSDYPRAHFDVGRVAQNLMVAANAVGLATCPVTIQRSDDARAALGVPGGYEIPMIVTLGHPAPAEPDREGSPRLPLDEIVRWERW